MGGRLIRPKLRVATLEEVAEYGSALPEGLLPPIAGASGFSITQSFTSSSTTATLTSAVAAGDFLYIVFGSSSYSSTPSTCTAVSDNVNGSWTLVDTNSASGGGSVEKASGVFAYFANSGSAAASGLTITVTVSGATSYEWAGVDLAGAGTTGIVGHAGATGTTWSPASKASPSVTDASAGDWVIAWASGYRGAATYSAGTGATLDKQINDGVGAGAVALWHLTANSANGSNGVNMSVTTTGYGAYIDGTVIVPAAGGGPTPTPNPRMVTWPQAMWRSAYR